MNIPPSLERLVQELARLPGIGQKTAQRLAFSILRHDEARAQALSEAVLQVKEKIRFCERCSGFAEEPLCQICQDPRRDERVICVVEQPSDIYVIERSGAFRGRYHVLMGVISPLDGVGPEQLKIRELARRLENEPAQELIIATNPSLQGEATALHLSRVLEGKAEKITRLARGMPVGANLEFTDDVTLSQAFSGRQDFVSS
ncbi:MAG: recombination mediator RecR [SAR324 cluster bacterium]|nr:recombination mediator RecR [SAR324 cluster bacterium]MCZ6557090.1 recombination mediator RecR [SAR324 cluster bacterium]